ncbi:MAG: DNA primase [Acidobacteria bacterium]|nr:DNA primase [Acidobacteriota bacterium]
MALYTDDSIERVRQAADLVEIVSAKSELKRSGRQYMGICPFHDERSPSLSVDPESKVFHCFGCGEGGDLFRFVELSEGVDFRGAVELLADRYAVPLELTDEDPRAAEKRKRRERLLELLERTAAYYVRNYWEGDEAAGSREYMAARGLDESMLREFRVGYAPSAWDRVLVASRQAGYSEAELIDAGLVARNDKGNVYDRFRRRITFPLCDARGRVLGFGARAVGADQKPKYLNSSDNAIFHKGRNVYAGDLARAAAAKAGEVILCEGYTDVIAMHQAGLRNTVGLMGTALTDDQVSELARMAPVVILALDADSAGQEAMVRAARVAAGKNIELRVLALPGGTDPAELIAAEGGDRVRELAAASVPFVRFRVDLELERGDTASAEGKDKIVAAIAPVLAPLAPGAQRDELLELAAEQLGVTATKLGEWVKRPAAVVPSPGQEPAPAPVPAPAPRGPAVLDPASRIERAFLVQCLALPSEGREALSGMDVEADLTNPSFRRIAALISGAPPGSEIAAPAGDEELGPVIAELQVRASQANASPAALGAERLRLALARTEREISAAKSSGGDLVGLVERRETLRSQIERQVEATLDQSRAAD